MVIDFAAFESIMSLVTIGMSVPDLRGADPEKIPELIEKARNLSVRKQNSDDKLNNKQKEPVIREIDLGQAENWDYYYFKDNGHGGKFTHGKDTLLKGNNDDPDTLVQKRYSSPPPIPNKNISPKQ